MNVTYHVKISSDGFLSTAERQHRKELLPAWMKGLFVYEQGDARTLLLPVWNILAREGDPVILLFLEQWNYRDPQLGRSFTSIRDNTGTASSHYVRTRLWPVEHWDIRRCCSLEVVHE